MRWLGFLFVAGAPLCGQELELDRYLALLKLAPGVSVESKVQALDELGITLSPKALRELRSRSRDSAAPVFGAPQLRSSDGRDVYLGTLSAHPFDPESVSNPFGRYGSPYSPDSINNPYGPYGSPYSPYSARNPYATQAPAIVTPEGKYLGKLSTNQYDPDSVSNRFGRYGSPYSADSINNRFGRYGSPFSPDSVRNRYAPPAPGFPRRSALPAR